ncbi:PaaI family thioesterase [Paraburkholderia sp. BR13439]|uniref:PaaI family thioesterase n=1 Tax=Paraburkholderia sp. BR13439 TaxID=3236996 RepID=UPI0034CE90AA
MLRPIFFGVHLAMTAAIHPYIRKIMDGELAAPPISTTLGNRIVLVDIEAGRIECEYQGLPAFANPAGQVQGGMLAAMLDDVTALLCMASLREDKHCATLSLNVSFLRPGKPGLITGRASLVRQGSRVVNVEGELWQDDKLLATATAVNLVA